MSAISQSAAQSEADVIKNETAPGANTHTRVGQMFRDLADSTLFADGSAPAAADLSMGTHKLTNLATPVSSTDAATKAYVDGLVQGLDIKGHVVALYSANLGALSGAPTTTDGVTPTTGDTVLLTAQSTQSQNGPWVTASGAWTRPANFANGSHAGSSFFFVQQGTLYADTGWVCTTDPSADVVGTNALAFAQFSAAGVIVADETTLHKVGNTLSILNNGVGNAQLRQGTACTVIGRSANSTGNVADIAAGSDGQYLVRRSGVLGFNSGDLTLDFASCVRIETGSATERGYISFQTSTDANGARFVGKKARGTSGSPTAVAKDDVLSALVGVSYDGGAYNEVGALRLVSDDAGGTSKRTRLEVLLHDGNTERVVSSAISARRQTTDATTTTVLTFAIPTSSTYEFAIRWHARDGSGNEQWQEQVYIVRRVGSGALAQWGATITTIDGATTFNDAAFGTPAAVISSNNLLVQVTGKVSTTIDHDVDVNIVAK